MGIAEPAISTALQIDWHRRVTPFGQPHVLSCIPHAGLIEAGLDRMRQYLIDAPTGHQVAAEKEPGFAAFAIVHGVTSER